MIHFLNLIFVVEWKHLSPPPSFCRGNVKIVGVKSKAKDFYAPSKFDAEAGRDDFVRGFCNAPTIARHRRNVHTEQSRSRSNAPAENRARRVGEVRGFFGRVPCFLHEQFCRRRARARRSLTVDFRV